jgi:hypothetical protein
VKVRILLTLPAHLVGEPILWELNRRARVVTNLRGTSITEAMALLALDVSGEPEEIQEAIDWLRSRGVRVTVGETLDA